MAQLNARAVDPSGTPMPGQLITLNTAQASDWGKEGITLNPNPRRTGPDGVVNFYSGSKLAQPIAVQATCQNGTTGLETVFDGSVDVTIDVIVLPFDQSLARSLPLLEQRGNDFVDQQGNRDFIFGCDGFLDYRIWLDQGPAGLEPFMRESQEIGFRTRRIFLAGSSAQNGVLNLFPQNEPAFYDQLGPFIEYQNSFGIAPLLTVNVDMQDVMPSWSDRYDNWRRVNGVIAGRGRKLISGGNQWSKNGFNPWQDIDDPVTGIVWSRGSDVDDTKTDPAGAPAGELHSTRVSWDRSLMDTTASPINMREHHYGMCWMTEGIPFDADSDPEYGRKLFRGYSIDWALAIFHNRQGQRGQLMLPGTRACAEAALRGAGR